MFDIYFNYVIAKCDGINLDDEVNTANEANIQNDYKGDAIEIEETLMLMNEFILIKVY
jgi:hypothetical protein